MTIDENNSDRDDESECDPRKERSHSHHAMSA
jgi:hypothetical protein